MRFMRVFFVALLPLAAVGCLSEGSRAKWLNPFPLLGGGQDPESALVQYVVIERPAGTEEINRRAWDRVDEQVLSFETRAILEESGLRVGTTGESAPGSLRKLIDDPRTAWGHRARTFGLDRPATLLLTGNLPRADFSLRAANGKKSAFGRDQVVLGFEMTVRDGPEGKVLVKLIPRARYHDPSQLMPADAADRGLATEVFPAAGFEIALMPNEYLVVGTDDYWEGTFGNLAFTGEKDDHRVQRLLVLHSTRNRSEKASSGLLGSDDHAFAPPIASQASTVRGSRP